MSKRVKAAINPTMLRWARESLGLPIGTVAEKQGLTVERLRAWESGDPEESPSVPQVERLAKQYDQPTSILYLPLPPTEPAFPRDFRLTINSDARIGLPPELRKVIRRARRLQNSALAIAEELGETNQRFPTIEPRAQVTDDAEVAGEAVRRWLGIGNEPHTNMQDGEAAFGTWRTAMEDRGILVFMSMEGLPVSTFRGFALVDERAPTIVINNKDEKPARLFSLLHELGHIVLGVSGICGELDNETVAGREQDRIEAWCNRFAGGALVPASLLRSDPNRSALIRSFSRVSQWEPDDDNRLRGLARRFAVSSEVIVLRLFAEGAITRSVYQSWRSDWYRRFPYRREPDPSQERKSGPGQTLLVPYRLGFGYMRIVFEAYWSERVSLFELCHLVGNVQVDTARKIENRFKAKLFAAVE